MQMRSVCFATVPLRFFAFPRRFGLASSFDVTRRFDLAWYLALVRYLALALALLAAATAALSQSDRGALAGTILDRSGAVVADASITATGVATGAVYKSTSTSTGAYRIQDMQVGAYDIVVTAPGFKTAKQTGFVIQIGTVAALDITLDPGDVNVEVSVVADMPTLQTESSDVGTVVSTRQIEELPLAVAGTGQSNLRSPEAFVFITPGTTGPGSSDSASGIFQAKLAGGQNFGNEIVLDGASTARADSGSAFDQTAPSVEALQEFKVTTSTVPADFGRTSGGVESFTTKSGTNAFHGTAFDIFRNEGLNANSWFNNLQHQPRNADKKNDYGGSLGGPVWIPRLYNGRDKTFFFFSWEQYRQSQGTTSTTTVPTIDERAGNFASLVNLSNPLGTNPCDATIIYQGQIFDPSTTKTVAGTQCRTVFPGNMVPISAVAQNILNYIPKPTTTDQNQYQNNFVFRANTPILDTTWTVRGDENFSAYDKLYFSFTKRNQDSYNTQPQFPVPVDVRFHHPFNTDYYRVGWDHFVSGTLLNHLNVGLNRILNSSVSTSADGTDWPVKLGISGAHGPIFPQINFNGGAQGLSNYGTANDDTDSVNSLVAADSVSWSKGRQTIRFGLDWRSFQFSHIDQAHESPGLSFDIGQTAAEPGQGALTGDPFASFLIGALSGVSLAVRSRQPRFISNYYAAFIQDDFKVRRDLMVNFGIRYEVETPRHEASYAQSVISLNVPNPGATTASGTPLLGALIFGGNGPGLSGTSATGARTYLKDFGPRVGFSYAPETLFGRFRNTVVRGGYAIYYAPLSYGDFGVSLTDGFTASPSWGSTDGYSHAFDPKTGNPVLLSTGVPAYPPPPNLDPAQQNGGFGGGFGGPTYVAQSYGRPGMVQNWSFEVEHQLMPDLILSVGYVGSHGTRLRSALAQINDLNPKYFGLGSCLTLTLNNTAGSPCASVTPPFTQFDNLYGSGAIAAQALRPFPQYQNINTDCCLENLGQSTYNALLVKVERRFRNGLNLLASYTFSKTLTDADSALPEFAQFSGGGYGQNPYNLRGEKSLSYQDIPHTFVLSYLYELPLGPGKKFVNHAGALGRAVGGWEVGAVQRYQSGQPLSFSCATGVPGFSTYISGCIRFDRVPGQPLLSPTAGSFDVGQVFLNGGGTGCTANPNGTFSAPAGVATYFNCAAFIDPNQGGLVASRGSYAFGNMPRLTGEVRSYRYVNEDFSIIKRTQIHESQSLIFKAELINAFNRHVFTRPDTGPTDGSFGGSGSTIEDPRKVQFTLRFQF
ncbi:MAG: hypothetical protein DMG41_21885 [Acidobacteria bacterium]|nr:MAG: hypothetical protein DMG41_21885 [Acidobacteriota bacterium]